MWGFKKKTQEELDIEEHQRAQKEQENKLLKIKKQEEHVFDGSLIYMRDMFVIFNKTGWYLVNVDGATCWYTIKKAVEAYNAAEPNFPGEVLEIVKMSKAGFTAL